MTVRYEKRFDTAYINLSANREKDDVALTYTCDSEQINALINLEFDLSGRLLGLEILDASRVLPKELVNTIKIEK